MGRHHASPSVSATPARPRSSTSQPNACMPRCKAAGGSPAVRNKWLIWDLPGIIGLTSASNTKSSVACSARRRAIESTAVQAISERWTTSSPHLSIARNCMSGPSSGNRHGNRWYAPRLTCSLTYRGQMICPRGDCLTSSCRRNPRVNSRMSIRKRSRIGPANTQGGTSRAAPGTKGNSRSWGDAVQPISWRSGPMSSQPNRGRTTRPPMTLRVVAERRGTAPTVPPGFTQRLILSASGTRAVRASRARSCGSLAERKFCAKLFQLRSRPETPNASGLSLTDAPWSFMISSDDAWRCH